MNPITTSGEWNQERLYVLRTLEDLKQEQKLQAAAAAADCALLIEKQAKDIGAAHDKIRKLENAKTRLSIQNWLMGALLGAIGAGALEFVKYLLARWKP